MRLQLHKSSLDPVWRNEVKLSITERHGQYSRLTRVTILRPFTVMRRKQNTWTWTWAPTGEASHHNTTSYMESRNYTRSPTLSHTPLSERLFTFPGERDTPAVSSRYSEVPHPGLQTETLPDSAQNHPTSSTRLRPLISLCICCEADNPEGW